MKTVPMNPNTPAPVAVEEVAAFDRLRIFQMECAMGEGRLSNQQAFAKDLALVLSRLQSQPPSAPSGSSAMDSDLQKMIREASARGLMIGALTGLKFCVDELTQAKIQSILDDVAAMLSAPTPSSNDGRAAE